MLVKAPLPASQIKFFILSSLLSIVLSKGLGQTSHPPDVSGGIAFTHVIVIDVTGASAKKDMTVHIRGNRIISVESSTTSKVPKNVQIIEAKGKFLIPGLWDMHVHLTQAGRESIPQFIAYGVTGVRDMGSDPFETIRQWKKEISTGHLTGPRIISAGLMLDNAPYTRERINVKNETEARQAVDSLLEMEVDFIKIYQGLSREAYFAIVDEAKKKNIPFAGHNPTLITLAEASDAGQKSIEHITNSVWPNPEDTSLYGKLRDNGTYITPTLIVDYTFSKAGEEMLIKDSRNQYVSKHLKENWARMAQYNIPADVDPFKKKMKTLVEWGLGQVNSLNEANVPLLAGSDVGQAYIFPGSSLHDELALLVQAGLSPMQALQTATINPATYFNTVASQGTIEKGKIADLVLLSANPLDNIDNIKKIEAVVSAGKLFTRKMLDELLEGSK